MAAGASVVPVTGIHPVFPGGGRHAGVGGGGGVGLQVTDPNAREDDIRLFMTEHGLDGRIMSSVQMSEKHVIKDIRMRVQAQHGWSTSGNTIMANNSPAATDKENVIGDDGDGYSGGLAIEKAGAAYMHLVVKLADLLFIRVKDADDKEHELSVPRGSTVRELKERIADAKGLAADQQSLVIRGRELEDHMPVVEYVDAASTLIHLVVRRNAKVKVVPVPGSRGREYELEISSTDTADTLKEKLAEAGGLPRSKSRILFENEILDEALPLASYGITDGSHLELEVADPGLYGSGSFSSPPLDGSSPPLSSSLHSLAGDFARAREGLACGLMPILADAGTGGTYFLKATDGETVAVFKPEDEEPLAHNNPRGHNAGGDASGEGLKAGIKVGEGAIREVAAFILDHKGFAGVPPTGLVNCKSHGHIGLPRGVGVRNSQLDSIGLCKRGSLQKFIKSTCDCEEMGTGAFSASEVHKICLLDMRLGNTDRNGANVLACRSESGSWTLVPIDHGYTLPSSLKDIYFEWITWRQSQAPFDDAAKEYVSKLDADVDVNVLAQHGIVLRPECETVLRVCTLLVKRGVAAGLTAHDIGSIMSRETAGMSVLEKLSSAAVKEAHRRKQGPEGSAARTYASVVARAGDLTEVSSSPEAREEYLDIMADKIGEYLQVAFDAEGRSDNGSGSGSYGDDGWAFSMDV